MQSQKRNNTLPLTISGMICHGDCNKVALKKAPYVSLLTTFVSINPLLCLLDNI